MKLILLVFFSIVVLNAHSQRNYRVGLGYNVGISTFYSTQNDGNNQLLNSEYGFKMNQGATLKFEIILSNRFDLYFQTGFQQRGVRLKNYLDAYDPRYRLSYWDVQLGTQFTIKKCANNQEVFTALGVTQHSLLLGKRVHDSGKDDIKDEFSKIDAGLSFGIGYKVPFLNSHQLEIQTKANVGFKQIYSGIFYQNGMRGSNLLIGINLNFLF